MKRRRRKGAGCQGCLCHLGLPERPGFRSCGPCCDARYVWLRQEGVWMDGSAVSMYALSHGWRVELNGDGSVSLLPVRTGWRP